MGASHDPGPHHRLHQAWLAAKPDHAKPGRCAFPGTHSSWLPGSFSLGGAFGASQSPLRTPQDPLRAPENASRTFQISENNLGLRRCLGEGAIEGLGFYSRVIQQ